MKNKNHILLDCSKMNNNATIKLARKIIDIVDDEYDSLVKININAQTD